MMERFRFLAATLIIAVILTGLGCNNGSTERGNDPWVFRSVLDWQPRMITMALADDFWVSYNTGNAALYRVWADGVSFEGPVYNQSHGPQPVSLGDAFFFEPAGVPWAIQLDGHRYTPEVRYGGHQLVGDDAEIFFDLILEDGSSVHVTERPSVGPGNLFRRDFSVEALPDGASIILAVEAASLRSEDGVTTDGQLTIRDQGDHSMIGEVVLNSSGRSFVEYSLQPDPQVHTVIVAPGQKPDDDRHPGVVLMESSDCSVCHNTEVQTVGPSYNAIAEKYVNSTYNISRLSKKVVNGGSGVWGSAMMTAHADLATDDAEKMVAYILSLDGEALVDGTTLSSRDAYPLDGSYSSGDTNQGVVINAYRFSEQFSQVPESVAHLDPVASFVAEGINAATNDDFGDLSENFYLEIVGSLNIPESENYVFRLLSDDGSLMYLDGKKIIDNDGLHGVEAADAELYLEAGSHPFVVKFFQGSGGKALALQWVRHGDEAFTTVPSEVFSYDPDDLKETKPFVEPERINPGVPGDKVPLVSVHPAYDLKTIRPDEFHPMVGGLDVADGKVFVSTWDPEGAVYTLENIDGDREDITVTKIASGLLEPLGLKVVDGQIYVLQKHELTRLVDTNSDGLIDRFETVCDGWGVSSNFHEFAFGLVYQDGYFYATLATAILPGGASAQPQVHDRGRVIRINPDDGSYDFIAEGLRTPNGIGIGVDGELFVADNQGDWLPSSKILHVTDGAFFGSRSVDFEGTSTKKEKPPVVWLPQDEIGNSPSQPALLSDGPYAGQLMHGEVTHGGIKRVFVEKVNGEYQGAVFRFIQGLEAGVNRLISTGDGNIYVGGIGNPGNWGQNDKLWYGLQRLAYNDTSVFEMLAVRARSNGMEIEFTEPIAERVNLSPEDFEVQQWKYVPTEKYGGPKVDLETLRVSEVNVSDDRKKVFLRFSGMKAGSVVYIYLSELFENEAGNRPWTTEAWYTLNQIPRQLPGFTNNPVTRDGWMNTLTQEEMDKGWQLLFDGNSTTGWHKFGGGAPGSDWKIVDGSLALGGDVDDWQFKDGGDIVTDDEFGDFDLRLEWRISPGGNSGIFYNVIEDTSRFQYAWQSGPEMQILDDLRHSDGRYVRHRSGDLYDMMEADAIYTRPVGQWNKVRIVQKDGRVQHWLNGRLLLEYEATGPAWQEMISKSKFGEMDGFGASTRGRIGLQDHGNLVAFRNIKILSLDD